MEADDLESLREMRQKLKQEELKPYSWEQFLVYFIDEITEVQKTGKSINNTAVQNYLMQVDDWVEMELRIYALFGFTFDVDTTYFLMKTALRKSQLYRSIPQDMQLLHTILTNNFSTFVFYGRYDYAEETIEIFDQKYSQEVMLLDPHLNFLFNRGLLAFCHKNVEKAEHYCEQAIALCKLFKQKKRGAAFQRIYDVWRKRYNEPDFKLLTIEPGIFGLFDV